MGEGKDDNSLPVLQRQQHISGSAVHMDITPKISSRNLQPWQCALVKCVRGRRNGACNSVHSGEKTCVGWGCKSAVSDVVQMCESSVRGSFRTGGLQSLDHSSEQSFAFTHALFHLVCLMDRKHFIFSPLYASFPTSPKGREAEKGVKSCYSSPQPESAFVAAFCVRNSTWSQPPALSLIPVAQVSLWWAAQKFSILSLGFLSLGICKITQTRS